MVAWSFTPTFPWKPLTHKTQYMNCTVLAREKWGTRNLRESWKKFTLSEYCIPKGQGYLAENLFKNRLFSPSSELRVLLFYFNKTKHKKTLCCPPSSLFSLVPITKWGFLATLHLAYRIHWSSQVWFFFPTCHQWKKLSLGYPILGAMLQERQRSIKKKKKKKECKRTILEMSPKNHASKRQVQFLSIIFSFSVVFTKPEFPQCHWTGIRNPCASQSSLAACTRRCPPCPALGLN